jgi:hypothetical protein
LSSRIHECVIARPDRGRPEIQIPNANQRTSLL